MSAAALRLLGLALLLGVVLVGAQALQTRWTAAGDAQGAARVQAAWDAHEHARNQAAARDNAAKAAQAERTAHEDAQRQAARAARDAAAAAAERGLRQQIAALNARAQPYPADDAGLAACAGEARTARELFGDSAAAYQELAAAADGLRDQVTGLQQFAHQVCGAPRLPDWTAAPQESALD